MANIKFTEKQWEKAREYRKAGLSLSQIAVKLKCSKSNLSVGLRGVEIEHQNEQLIEQATRVRIAKNTMSPIALEVHEEIVDEKAHWIKYFSHVAITNVREAMEFGCENQSEFKARAETISKAREVVLGKQIDTAIQINSGQPVSEVVYHVVDVNEN